MNNAFYGPSVTNINANAQAYAHNHLPMEVIPRRPRDVRVSTRGVSFTVNSFSTAARYGPVELYVPLYWTAITG